MNISPWTAVTVVGEMSSSAAGVQDPPGLDVHNDSLDLATGLVDGSVVGPGASSPGGPGHHPIQAVCVTRWMHGVPDALRAFSTHGAGCAPSSRRIRTCPHSADVRPSSACEAGATVGHTAVTGARIPLSAPHRRGTCERAVSTASHQTPSARYRSRMRST